MKNITKSLIILLGIFAFSCNTDDVEDRPVVVATDAPVLSAPATGASYILNIEDAAMQAERFVWSSANFAESVAITYTVEIDKAGNNFASPQVLGTAISANQLSVSVESLNGAVLSAGGEPFVEGTYEVRVKSSINATFDPLYSNVASITVTPYVAVVPPLYLVGAPQAHYGVGAWTPENGIQMRYIGDGVTRVYEAYVKIAAGEGFKFIGGLNWDNGNYGTIGGTQDGNLENSGGSGDIKVADTDGLYYVMVDIDELTYKAVKMNWGIIGAATPGGWGAETPMIYDFANNKFTLSTTLTADNMKFRAKNAGDAIYANEWKFQIGNSDPMVAYDNGAGDIAITTPSVHNIELMIGFTGIATVTGL